MNRDIREMLMWPWPERSCWVRIKVVLVSHILSEKSSSQREETHESKKEKKNSSEVGNTECEERYSLRVDYNSYKCLP